MTTFVSIYNKVGTVAAAMLIGLTGVLGACDSHRTEPVEIWRFDRAMTHYRELDAAGRDSLWQNYQPVVELLEAAYSTTADSALMQYASSAALAVFQPDVERRLPDLAPVEQALGQASASAAELIPQSAFPTRFYGIVTPFAQSVVMVDSAVIIGLNHYLGADYEGYAGYVDAYQLPLKERGRIAPDVVEAWLRLTYPQAIEESTTTLQRMLYEGALLTAMKQLLPDLDEAYLMGFSAEAYRWAVDNEAQIWRALAERSMLYSTDPMVADRLLQPAPTASILTPTAPGRIGRYTGRRIVESYLADHDTASIAYLLSPLFYDSPRTLIEAGYAPK